MEIGVLALAAFFAFVGGGSLMIFAYGFLKNASRSQKIHSRSGIEGSFGSGILRHGVPVLNASAVFLLGIPAVSSYMSKIGRSVINSGRATSKEALLSLLIAMTIVVFVLGSVVSSTLICGAVLAVCSWLGLGVWANRQCDQWHEQLREAIPEALQSMKACFQVGYTLSQTISEVQKGAQGPLGELFGEVEGVLETGGSTEDALSVLKKSSSEPELAFLSTALEIQHHTGSSMQEVLEITRQSISDEIELKRTLRTQTAQAKLSAQIITIMPFVLVGLFSLISPGFLDPFFGSLLGIILLVCALSMQVLGVLMVRKMLKVEVI